MSKIGTIGFERLNLDKFPQDHYFRNLQGWLDKNALLGNFFDYVTVNGVPIHFQKTYKRIGINFSGGADSTMLLFILATIIDTLKINTKIYPLSVARFHDLEDFSEATKEKVYDFLKHRFSNIIEPIVWGFIPTPFEYNSINKIQIREKEAEQELEYLSKTDANLDVLYFHYFNNWISKKYNLDAVYNGTTTNPVTSDYIPGVPIFRNSIDNLFQHVPTIRKFSYAKNLVIVVPFERLEKSWVTAQYENFDVKDLFQITQSCVTVFNGCNDFTECFHCAERDWSVKNKFYYLKENAYEF